MFLIHLLHVPHKTELFLVSLRAAEVPAFTQFIKVLMEDNYELNYSMFFMLLAKLMAVLSGLPIH